MGPDAQVEHRKHNVQNSPYSEEMVDISTCAELKDRSKKNNVKMFKANMLQEERYQ